MTMFSSLSKSTLARAALFHDAPVYVQFYITARCNLTCNQCNIIYANSDVRECSIDAIKRIADNFAQMKVAMVLLTGGEPFAREDLPEIVYAFESRGVHVRMQTNGLASDENIQRVVEKGGRDISISLDSLWPGNQDAINGGFQKSWHEALRAMASFMRYLPATNSFASLGCVLQRDNVSDVEDVIRFGTEVGWFTSLVPIHITTHDKPMSFRTFDQTKRWQAADIQIVEQLVERVRAMRREGFWIYDSDQYLDDVLRFVRDQPTTWRSKNDGVCDSPNLYFAVLPNGAFAPCCDHRLRGEPVFAYGETFPRVYRDRQFRARVADVVRPCSGCMYGSYPEITISMRYLAAKWDRLKLFLAKPPEKPWPMTYEQLLTKAETIRSENRARIALPGSERRLSLGDATSESVSLL